MRELELHALKIGKRFSKLFAFLRVSHGMIERALRQPNHLRADADASLVQRFDGDLVAAADFAEHVGPRDTTIFQQQLARAAGANAKLVLFLSNGEPGESALD